MHPLNTLILTAANPTKICSSQSSRLVGRKYSTRLQCIRPPTPFNVLFFGGDEFSCRVFDRLYQAKDVWQRIDVVTQPDMKVGRRRTQVAVSPLRLLVEDRVPVSCIPEARPDFRSWKPPPPFDNARDPSAVLITASFGRIIPNSLLKLFPPSRRLNVHPSLLPNYRGPSPIQHAIIDGKDRTGVCVIEMKEKALGIDSGEVWGKKAMYIPPGIMFSGLRERLAEEGGDLLVSVLRDMLDGKATAIPQLSHSSANVSDVDPVAGCSTEIINESEITYAPMITPDMANINLCSWDAGRIDRLHRAILHQRPLTTTLPSSKRLKLLDLRPLMLPLHLSQTPLSTFIASHLRAPGDCIFEGPSTKSLIIRCANDTYVSVKTVHQQDRKVLEAKEWWNGIRPEWLKDGVLRLGQASVSS